MALAQVQKIIFQSLFSRRNLENKKTETSGINK